jgi:hypothetical protein
MVETPFDSIESAHEYVRLLASEVEGVTKLIQKEIADASAQRAERRVDTLRLVDYKLKQLGEHLGASRRILNDLQILRRLLLGG